MSVFLAPIPLAGGPFFVPGSNAPASGGLIFTYSSGSSSKINTFTTSSGAVANPNPLVLDSGGNISGSGEIWLTQGQQYRFVLAPANDADPPSSPYWIRDSITGINDPTGVGVGGEWIVFSGTPTFAGATSFTVAGDQTATFTVGRRTKSTVTAGTVFSTITASSFAAGVTTVTVVNDSGVLDAGLNSVSYGALSAPNGSIPFTQVTATGLSHSATTAINSLSVTGSVQGNLRVVSSLVWGSGVANFGTITISKSSSQSVTGSNFVNDADLTFPILANEEWVADYSLSLGGAPGVNFGLSGIRTCVSTVPAGAILQYQGICNCDVGSSQAFQNATGLITFNNAVFTGAQTAVTKLGLWIKNSTTAGNVTLQWASVNATSTLTMARGSYMNAIRRA